MQAPRLMKELREFERYPLTIPARAVTTYQNKKQAFDFKTKDISASGIFMYTSEPFPNGSRFRLFLTIPNPRIKKLTGAESLIDCEGTVVRTTPSGVGIRFDKRCHISSLRSL